VVSEFTVIRPGRLSQHEILLRYEAVLFGASFSTLYATSPSNSGPAVFDPTFFVPSLSVWTP